MNNKQIRDSWGRFLDCRGWDIMFTFTFRDNARPEFALRQFGRFRKYLERVVGHRVSFFVVVEEGAIPGGAHLHGFLGDIGSLTPSDIAAMWQHGFTRVVWYNPEKGGAYYVAKSLDRDDALYEMSSRLPSEGRCREAA